MAAFGNYFRTSESPKGVLKIHIMVFISPKISLRKHMLRRSTSWVIVLEEQPVLPWIVSLIKIELHLPVKKAMFGTSSTWKKKHI